MIRDERQAALDDAIVALQNEAAHGRDAAERLDHTHLAQLLRDTAEHLERYAERLKPDMQHLGDLPSEPDQEAEFLEGLFSRIQAALSEDAEASVVAERIDGLGRLLETLRAALDAQPPTPVDEHLRAALRFARGARERLEDLSP